MSRSTVVTKYQNDTSAAINFLIDIFDHDQVKSQNIIRILHCNGSISECDHFKALLIVMNDYEETNHSYLELIDIDDVINNYIHLIHQHDDDESFDYIHNKLNAPTCDILQCHLFMRNHRNRNKTNLSNLYHSNDEHIIIRKQILDKIHCHFTHSFDIGHRLRTKDKINENDINSLIKSLKNKHVMYTQISRKLDESTNSKFVTTLQHKNDNDILNEYDFGIDFFYDDEWWSNVKNKYKSFKEELLCNKTMSASHFNWELKKAEKHHNSRYCQKVLINKVQRKNEENNPEGHVDITVEHILSAMIYCNYDVLQEAFTKTYRRIYSNESKESMWKRHEEFYFLGKFLKQTVRRIGTKIHRGNITKFYHGVGETLLFSLKRINKILSPLSTSSSKAVGIHFASSGILVEFGDQEGSAFNMHFNVSWCSDFTNEHEYLFVQSAVGLKLVNIINVNTCFECRIYLEAMNLLNSMDVFSENYNAPKAEIAVKLIKHETKMEEWDSLNVYVQNMFHVYCSKKTFLGWSWKELESYVQIYDIFKSDKYDGIDIGFVNRLYPHLEEINIFDMNLCILLLESVWNHLHAEMTCLQTIEIHVPKQNEGISINDAVEIYAEKFSLIGFCIEIGDGKSILIWEQQSEDDEEEWEQESEDDEDGSEHESEEHRNTYVRGNS
eukprot:24492_1